MNDNIVENPDWWPHRYDANRDAIQFIKVTRDEHRQAVFLTAARPCLLKHLTYRVYLWGLKSL